VNYRNEGQYAYLRDLARKCTATAPIYSRNEKHKSIREGRSIHGFEGVAIGVQPFPAGIPAYTARSTLER
jgi:hypothetical protein